MPIQHSEWAERVPLIEYRGLDWSRIRRTRFFCYQRFHYVYPGPIRNLHQNLVVIPPDRYGDQRVVDHELTAAPHPAIASQLADRWGNRVWKLEVKRVDREIAFESIMTIERTTPESPPIVSRSVADALRESTELTTADARIGEVARELAAVGGDPESIAERASAWVSDAMRYGSGATGVHTTAAQALMIGTGLCQDYAHIMLAICRAAGIAARYVSGHMLADGGSHAWVEVLVPQPDGDFRAVAFDPTNRRRPNMSYAIVAVGRDYRDVAPASGSFSAPYGGRLSFSKRAGLRLVEYVDGTIAKPSEAALA